MNLNCFIHTVKLMVALLMGCMHLSRLAVPNKLHSVGFCFIDIVKLANLLCLLSDYLLVKRELQQKCFRFLNE